MWCSVGFEVIEIDGLAILYRAYIGGGCLIEYDSIFVDFCHCAFHLNDWLPFLNQK